MREVRVTCGACGRHTDRELRSGAVLARWRCPTCGVSCSSEHFEVEELGRPSAAASVDRPTGDFIPYFASGGFVPDHPNCRMEFMPDAALDMTVTELRDKMRADMAIRRDWVREPVVLNESVRWVPTKARSGRESGRVEVHGEVFELSCCSKPDPAVDAVRNLLICAACNTGWAVETILALRDHNLATSAKLREEEAVAKMMLETQDALSEIAMTVEPEPMPWIKGSVVGYRAWQFDTSDDDWCLTGIGSGNSWAPGQEIFEAECNPGDIGRFELHEHPAPDPDCDCGIYALARFQEEARWWWGDNLVRGAIEAWGDVDANGYDRMFIQAPGFRAQWAKIVLLAIEDDWRTPRKAAVRALAKEYGADVCKAEHLAAAATEHGQLVPDDVLEWSKGEDVWRTDGVQPSAAVKRLVTKAEQTKMLLDQWNERWLRGEIDAKTVRDMLAKINLGENK